MNIREADKALGEVFHLVERNTVMTKDLDEAFSMIHYALEKIEEKEKRSCDNCDHKSDSALCTCFSIYDIPPIRNQAVENVTFGKELLSEIIHYLSLDKQCKFSPNEYCDSHVDCVDCDIAKAQSITLQRIEKEFAKWSKNGI